MSASLNGKAYFSEMTLQKIEMFLRDMKDDFGIIPIPKRNEAQENYIACVNGAGGFVVVPANAENPERTGRIMERSARREPTTASPRSFTTS